MIVRWLGAFGRSKDLESSLEWELTQTEKTAVSAERLIKGKSFISHASVGLLVKNRAILRKFYSDMYSKYRKNGKLCATRRQNEAQSRHTECYVRADYVAIVIKKQVSDDIVEICKKTGLDVLRLTRDGRLVNM